MIAEVIVDVATSAIDRSFDYVIPEHLIEVTQVGCRVQVPFGARTITGFIVGLKDETTIPEDKRRSVIDVIDFAPLLTNEMMTMAKWIKKDTLCLEIDVLQMMLPAALRSTYEKVVVLDVPVENLPEDSQAFFNNKDFYILPADPSAAEIRKWKKLTEQGLVHVETTIKQKTSMKKVSMVKITSDFELLQTVSNELSKGAVKQRELLNVLHHHIGETIALKKIVSDWGYARTVLKPLVEKGIAHIFEKEVYREPVDHDSIVKQTALQLTDEQHTAFTEISGAISENRADTYLLHGITGSGKTEVYLQSIAHALQQGKQAIMLVPEIALTPQMTERFVARFGSQVAVLHSGLSAGEKYDEWRKIHRGEVTVVVGARSAIFAPFQNVGIIIVDEEHETTYKQEDSPRYHARDVAIWRSEYNHCPVVLGSATPSLESFARAQKQVYKLLTLTQRPKSQPLPEVTLIDMREQLKLGNRSMFSTQLIEAIRLRLERREQVVLLLNKRGYSSFVLCRDCGTVVQCPHCDISLTYHRANEKMKCHYCAFEMRVPPSCPSCQSEHIRFFGTGTQKVEEEIAKLFPSEKLLRMDVDTTRTKGSHSNILDAFGRGDASILLGTQMIAKGLDFPNVTLVGVLTADTALFVSDFRSAEKTFQLLAQVSGRAGRHEKEGEVIIQTYAPEHYAIEFSKFHDFEGFYTHEMKFRKDGKYPPYTYIVSILFSHEDLLKVGEYAHKSVEWLREQLLQNVEIIGPAASSISKMQNRYRYQCLIKYKKETDVQDALQTLQNVFQTHWMKNGFGLVITKNPSIIY